MYLRTIFELEEEGKTPLRARIAERLGQSGPTVSQTVARMERDGQLTVGPDRSLALSETGREMATRVMRKHRLAECLLVDVIGMPWEDVHEEACRWEHVMSDEVERRLIQLLDHPTTSPFGNPIPGLAELGESGPRSDNVESLSSTCGPESRTFAVVRIGEQLQHDAELLRQLARAGVKPGQHIQAVTVPAGIRVSKDGSAVELPLAAAESIMVEAGN